MFVKAIAFRDVRRGDMVSENADCGWYEIVRCESVNGGAEIRLHILGGGVLVGAPGQLIGLFRRARVEGATKQRMLEDVAEAARKVYAVVHGFTIQDHLTEPDDVLKALRELMDAYELGRPPKMDSVPDLTAGGC